MAVFPQDDDASLRRFCAEAQRHSILDRESEARLARRYRDEGDEAASQELVVSNLRFVIRTAHDYRGYGVRLVDLVQEGNIGLMVAVKKFDPERGYRLVSYAVWWIRAYIQSYIMRSWSLVKVGTTQVQRKLFFRLRSERDKLERLMPAGERANADLIAKSLAVSACDVEDMERRLGERDYSLDSTGCDTHQAGVAGLVDGGKSPLDLCEDADLLQLLRDRLHQAVALLNDKERVVMSRRILAEDPPTLKTLGDHLGVSRQRVRQIETQIIGKLRRLLLGPANVRPGAPAAHGGEAA